MQHIWTSLYRAAGVPRGAKFEQITDSVCSIESSRLRLCTSQRTELPRCAEQSMSLVSCALNCLCCLRRLNSLSLFELLRQLESRGLRPQCEPLQRSPWRGWRLSGNSPDLPLQARCLRSCDSELPVLPGSSGTCSADSGNAQQQSAATQCRAASQQHLHCSAPRISHSWLGQRPGGALATAPVTLDQARCRSQAANAGDGITAIYIPAQQTLGRRHRRGRFDLGQAQRSWQDRRQQWRRTDSRTKSTVDNTTVLEVFGQAAATTSRSTSRTVRCRAA